MIERSIKTRSERRATNGDKRGRPSTTIRMERKKRAKVRRLTSFERERILYLILSFILNQWKNLRIGVM